MSLLESFVRECSAISAWHAVTCTAGHFGYVGLIMTTHDCMASASVKARMMYHETAQQLKLQQHHGLCTTGQGISERKCLSMAGAGQAGQGQGQDDVCLGQGRAGHKQAYGRGRGLRSDLAPEIARQHTREWSHDDEQPEGGAAGHHLLKEMENALGQVLRQHSVDQHVHKPDDCTTQKTWI